MLSRKASTNTCASVKAKEYVETLLKAVGRSDIEVTFDDPAKGKHVTAVTVSSLSLTHFHDHDFINKNP